MQAAQTPVLTAEGIKTEDWSPSQAAACLASAAGVPQVVLPVPLFGGLEGALPR